MSFAASYHPNTHVRQLSGWSQYHSSIAANESLHQADHRVTEATGYDEKYDKRNDDAQQSSPFIELKVTTVFDEIVRYVACCNDEGRSPMMVNDDTVRDFDGVRPSILDTIRAWKSSVSFHSGELTTLLSHAKHLASQMKPFAWTDALDVVIVVSTILNVSGKELLKDLSASLMGGFMRNIKQRCVYITSFHEQVGDEYFTSFLDSINVFLRDEPIAPLLCAYSDMLEILLPTEIRVDAKSARSCYRESMCAFSLFLDSNLHEACCCTMDDVVRPLPLASTLSQLVDILPDYLELLADYETDEKMFAHVKFMFCHALLNATAFTQNVLPTSVIAMRLTMQPTDNDRSNTVYLQTLIANFENHNWRMRRDCDRFIECNDFFELAFDRDRATVCCKELRYLESIVVNLYHGMSEIASDVIHVGERVMALKGNDTCFCAAAVR